MRNVAAFLLLALSIPAQAATFNVDVGIDQPDAQPGDGKCSFIPLQPNQQPPAEVCTLRAAIMEANATVVHDTIVLSAGSTYLVNIPGRDEDNAATGDLDIRQPVTIQPPMILGIPAGQATVLVQGGVDRAFDIITVQDAGATLTGLNIQGGDSGGNLQKPGAGINLDQSNANFSFLDVSVLSGHGVYVHGNPFEYIPILHSTIAGSADQSAIEIHTALLDIQSSSFVDSRVGIRAQFSGTEVVIRNSTISGNEIGISVGSSATVDVIDSTIAASEGRGMFVMGAGTIISSKRTLFASNGLWNCEAITNGIFTMEDNVYDDDSCPQDGVNDDSLFNTTVYLSLLGDHGGFTPTHRPMTNSPALDAITGPACSEDDYDQRLMPRATAFKGGQPACDIGAVELETDVIFFDQFDRL